MSTTNEKQAELLATAITECAMPNCPYLAVRMVCERNTEGDADFDMVMLCRRHAALYQPQGPVVFDQIMVSQENLDWMAKNGL